MTMADKIAVLSAGRLEQVGAPLDLYRAPANLFVAGFIGSPQMNFVTGDLAARAGTETIGIRPEHLAVSRDGDGWRGRVVAAEHLGSDTFIHVEVAGAGRLTARTVGDMPVGSGDEVVLTPMAGHLHRFGADGRAV
jgi:multiple sugar transport system ATP-binding protein